MLIKSSGTSALTVVISPLSTVGELVNLTLWYTMYPERFGGGGGILGKCLLEHDDLWVTVPGDDCDVSWAGD